MAILPMRALVSEGMIPPVLGAELPDLTTHEGRSELAGWQQEYGYGAILHLCDTKLREQASNVDVLVLQAECALHQGLFALARSSIERARSLAPERRDVMAMHALVTLEDLDAPGVDLAYEGGGDADLAKREHVDTPSLMMAAQAKDLFVHGDRKALRVADQAVALNPNNVWARMVQTELTAHLMGAEDSAAGAEALQALAPKSPAALWCVIRSQTPCLRQQRNQEVQKTSLQELKRINSLAPGSAYACLASAYLGVYGGNGMAHVSHDFDEALMDDLWPLDTGPMLSMALMQARAQADGGNIKGAQATLDRAQKTFDKAYPILALQAELYAAQNDIDSEMACLAAARPLAQGSQFTEVCLRLSSLAIAQGDIAAAAQQLRAVLRAAPTHSEALLMLAQVHLQDIGCDPDERVQQLHSAQALAERALLGDALFHPQAHFIIGLSAIDVIVAQNHLRQAIEAFAEDPTRRLDAQRALYCRLVENGDFAAAQKVLDATSEDMWPIIAAYADDATKDVEKFRGRRLGEATIASARAANSAHDYEKAIQEIRMAEGNLDIRDDAELLATLLGIKALAYLKLELHTSARETARRALDAARESAILNPIPEAELVRELQAEHVRQERKKALWDFVTRYLWLVIGAGGATSLYTMGMSLITMLRDAFKSANSRSRLTAHMRPTTVR